MKICFFGDVFSNVGKTAIFNEISILKQNHEIDLVIANIENITNGKSISDNDYQECKNAGIDFFTSGNHIMYLKQAQNLLNTKNDIIRPANWGNYAPGKGSMIISKNNKKIQITNLIGNSFMNSNYENPYIVFDKILKQNLPADIHIVDFHAETTSEKISFAWNYDGKITALFGTHTHIPTADARIMPKGTAYVTDVGMNGPFNSAIGIKFENIIYRQKTLMPTKFECSDNPAQLCYVLLTIDDKTNKATNIEHIIKFPK